MASTLTRLTLTDDTGTAASPAGDGTPLDNDFLWDYVYAPVDQLFSGVGLYATFTFGGLVAASGFGVHQFAAGGTGGNRFGIRNTTAGTTNYAGLHVGNDVSFQAGQLVMTASSYTNNAPYYQDGLTVQCERAGGVNVAATHAAGVIRLTAGGTSEKGRVTATGGLVMGDTTDPGAGALRLRVAAANTGLTVTDGTVTGVLFASTALTNSMAIGTTTNHPLVFGTNNVFPQMTLNATGQLFISSVISSNAFITVGLTINQGANDNSILSFQSSDIAHGMTLSATADTFADFGKTHPTQGGGTFRGFSTTTGAGLTILGCQATPDTAKSSAANAAVNINGGAQSGTGLASLGTNGNILAVRDNGSTRFLLDADGDSHQDAGTSWTNFDGHDDALVLSSLAVAVSRPGDPWRDRIRQGFAGALGSLLPRRDLARLRLATFNADGSVFVNMSKLTMLHTGAIRQMARELGAVRAALPAAARRRVARRLEAARG